MDFRCALWPVEDQYRREMRTGFRDHSACLYHPNTLVSRKLVAKGDSLGRYERLWLLSCVTILIMMKRAQHQCLSELCTKPSPFFIFVRSPIRLLDFVVLPQITATLYAWQACLRIRLAGMEKEEVYPLLLILCPEHTLYTNTLDESHSISVCSDSDLRTIPTSLGTSDTLRNETETKHGTWS